MKKVLIFPYSNQLGTTIPCINLAQLLQNEGYQVEFASYGKYTNIIQEKGFKNHVAPEVSYKHYRENIDNNKMDYLNADTVRIFVDFETKLIKELNPDIVVGQQRQTLYISTKLTKKKYINITIASLTPYYDQKYFIPENLSLQKLIPFIDVNKIIPQNLIHKIFNYHMRKNIKGVNKALKYYNLQPVTSFLDINTADLVLLVETFGLVKTKELPDNYLYLEQDASIGVGKKPKWADKVIKEKKSKNKKVIALSMGSSAFTNFPNSLETLLKFVKRNEDKYILITNHCDINRNYKTQKNIYIEKFIQPNILLDLADIVITHGGKNTLNEIILAGIPVIGIPEQTEQLWNLKYIESLGFAKVLLKNKLKKNENLLTNSIINLLNDKELKIKLNKFVKEILNNNDFQNHKKNILNAIKNL